MSVHSGRGQGGGAHARWPCAHAREHGHVGCAGTLDAPSRGGQVNVRAHTRGAAQTHTGTGALRAQARCAGGKGLAWGRVRMLRAPAPH
eukprot:1769180-Pleurochrysis_carterae.AAC.1